MGLKMYGEIWVQTSECIVEVFYTQKPIQKTLTGENPLGYKRLLLASY